MKTEVGEYVICMIDGSVSNYIAEIIKSDPIVVKICESGPLSKVKDHIIWEEVTKEFQSSEKQAYLVMQKYQKNGSPLVSGLKSLGVEDNELHQILPPDNF